jgi:hypothetical protein
LWNIVGVPNVCGSRLDRSAPGAQLMTFGTKLYAAADTELQEVHFMGINLSGMENVEGVHHGLAAGQSKLVRHLVQCSIRTYEPLISPMGSLMLQETIPNKLTAMEINAARLPLITKMVIEDSQLDATRFASRSQMSLFGVSTHTDVIKKLVQRRSRVQIAVLLDLRKIDPLYNAPTFEMLWLRDHVSGEGHNCHIQEARDIAQQRAALHYHRHRHQLASPWRAAGQPRTH